LGLDFIKKTTPVTFYWKPSNEVPQELTNHYNEVNVKNTETLNYGFIAQDVKQALEEAGVDDFPVIDQDKDGTLGVGIGSFMIPVINAVKELSAQVDQLKAEISALKGE
jgi:hypothetical protein